MANIAQTVNVLQAMILTDKEKMILTPTYHVFDMYKVHQGATPVTGGDRGGANTERATGRSPRSTPRPRATARGACISRWPTSSRNKRNGWP